jgi:hypothetical protein
MIAAKPRPPSSTTTSMGYSPADASGTRQVILVEDAEIMEHVEESPMRTRLPSRDEENPEPVMVRVVPVEMVEGDTAVTAGVRVDWYAKAQAAPRPVPLVPQEAWMPLVHTRTEEKDSATCGAGQRGGGRSGVARGGEDKDARSSS